MEGDKLPNSGEITRVFMEQKDGLLNYGVYAAKLPMATEKVEVALSFDVPLSLSLQLSLVMSYPCVYYISP